MQLPSYNFTKNLLVKNDILPANSLWTFLASSSVSGMCVVNPIRSRRYSESYIYLRVQCLVMQPADTALTRVYNQPTIVGQDGRIRGALYKNPIDCLWKTFRAEGIYGWYKGIVYYTGFLFGYLLNVYLQVQLHTFCVSPHTRMSFC